MSVARIRFLAGDLDNNFTIVSDSQVEQLILWDAYEDDDGNNVYDIRHVAANYCRAAATHLADRVPEAARSFRERSDEILRVYPEDIAFIVMVGDETGLPIIGGGGSVDLSNYYTRSQANNLHSEHDIGGSSHAALIASLREAIANAGGPVDLSAYYTQTQANIYIMSMILAAVPMPSLSPRYVRL